MTRRSLLGFVVAVVLLVSGATTARAASGSPAGHAAAGAQEGVSCTTDATIAALGDLPPANTGNLVSWLGSQGIAATRVFWDESFLDNVSDYDLVIFNRASGLSVTDQEFLQFLADADSAGTGVVFLGSRSSGFTSGIGRQVTHAGNPSQFWTDYSGASLYKFYDVTQAHPILDGFEVGERIRLDESPDFTFKDLMWFTGYQGDGRQVVGNAGLQFRGDRVKGPGIGAQERPTNRHALLSLHGVDASFNASEWNQDASRIFLNAMDWVAPPTVSFNCTPA